MATAIRPRGAAGVGGSRLSRRSVSRGVFAALAVGLALAGCGGGAAGGPALRPPTGSQARDAVADRLAVELVRVRLRAASDLYGLGRFPDARAHLAAARAGFAPLEPRLGARNPRLAREVDAAFELLAAWTARGDDRQRVRERMGPVADQLMEGALEALVPGRYRADPGVQATVVDGLLEDLESTYRLSAGDDLGARRARQRAYGLLDRAQAIGQSIEDSLGPQRDPVLDPLAVVRFEAYSGGLGPPAPPGDGRPAPPARPPPPERVSDLLSASRAALGRAPGG